MQITNYYDNTFSTNYAVLIEKLTKAVFNYNLYLYQISEDKLFFYGRRDFL